MYKGDILGRIIHKPKVLHYSPETVTHAPTSPIALLTGFYVFSTHTDLKQPYAHVGTN